MGPRTRFFFCVVAFGFCGSGNKDGSFCFAIFDFILARDAEIAAAGVADTATFMGARAEAGRKTTGALGLGSAFALGTLV